jgi:hypothetical protein
LLASGINHAYRYTLGGFYLARYDDSPVGAFEEVGYRTGMTSDEE